MIKTFSKVFIRSQTYDTDWMKSQSAMEYLMTYGWAILIIAIVLVAFFSLGLFNPYTFKPKASPGSCQVVRPNGPTTNTFVSIVGTCLDEIPQSVASFNGDNNYVYVPYSPILQLTNSSSFSFWIYPTSLNSADLIERGIGSGATQYYIRYRSNTQFEFDIGTGVTSYDLPATSTDVGILVDKWVQITIVVNNTGNIAYLYVNGVKKVSNSSTSLSYSQNDNPLYIGGFSWDGYSAGYISNVQIYNTSLTANEVTVLYNEGIGGKPVDIQHIVGWWPLNGNAYDYSGNYNNGTATNVKFISNWETGYTAP